MITRRFGVTCSPKKSKLSYERYVQLLKPTYKEEERILEIGTSGLQATGILDVDGMSEGEYKAIGLGHHR